MTDIPLPTFTDSVDQRFFISPFGGPSNPTFYLDRFPDEVYNKAPDSHLVRYMYSLLGPSGVGWLHKNTLEAKLRLYAMGLELFDMEKFYGDPMRFGRILEERFNDNVAGLLTREEWDTLKAKDESYRNRAILFLNAVRLGTTPEGMRYAARSGLNHNVEIVENYKWLFDSNSDEYKGFPRFGTTTSTNEFTVVPRQEVARSESQKLTVTGSPTSGQYTLSFRQKRTVPLFATSTLVDIQQALEALTTIGRGNVVVTGGGSNGTTITSSPVYITFRHELANQDLPLIEFDNQLGQSATMSIEAVREGEAADDVVSLDVRNLHNMQKALDYLRPVNSVPTTSLGAGNRNRQNWAKVQASSTYTEVIRYISGQPNVTWPSSSTEWIEKGVEKPAPRAKGDLQHHYVSYLDRNGVRAYTEVAGENPTVDTANQYPSYHVGRFDPTDTSLHPSLNINDDLYQYTPDRSFADYAEPLTTTTDANGNPVINGIYPISYTKLGGIPAIKYNDEQFWASKERLSGTEYLEIDLGRSAPVNYVICELIHKPFDIDIEYDGLGVGVKRSFRSVSPLSNRSFTSSLFYDPSLGSSWNVYQFEFGDANGDPVVTRYIRLKFTRRTSDIDTGAYSFPWSINVRNLRLGRNVVLS